MDRMDGSLTVVCFDAGPDFRSDRIGRNRRRRGSSDACGQPPPSYRDTPHPPALDPIFNWRNGIVFNPSDGFD